MAKMEAAFSADSRFRLLSSLHLPPSQVRKYRKRTVRRSTARLSPSIQGKNRPQEKIIHLPPDNSIRKPVYEQKCNPGIIAGTISSSTRPSSTQTAIPAAAPAVNTSRLILLVLRSCHAAIPKNSKNRLTPIPPFFSHNRNIVPDVPLPRAAFHGHKRS